MISEEPSVVSTNENIHRRQFAQTSVFNIDLIIISLGQYSSLG